MYDIGIIGGGTAGLTAAIYGQRAFLNISISSAVHLFFVFAMSYTCFIYYFKLKYSLLLTFRNLRKRIPYVNAIST